jgi:hypothetical protein
VIAQGSNVARLAEGRADESAAVATSEARQRTTRGAATMTDLVDPPAEAS